VGGDVTVGEGLELDGALVLRAMPGASLRVEANLKVRESPFTKEKKEPFQQKRR
jgi:hypothetical protein